MISRWESGRHRGSVLGQPVLVLNRNYLALAVCAMPRALRMLATGKAELLVPAPQMIATAGRAIPAPAVIRVDTPAMRLARTPALSRREVFIRDRYTCQYCGRALAGAELTLDHIMPRHRGGTGTWENLVTACRPCNHRKAGQTPAEARMRLAQPAYGAPRQTIYGQIARMMPDTVRPLWQDFLPAGTL